MIRIASHTKTHCLFYPEPCCFIPGRRKKRTFTQNHESRRSSRYAKKRKRIAVAKTGVLLSNSSCKNNTSLPLFHPLPSRSHIPASSQEIPRILVASIRCDLHPVPHNRESIRIECSPFFVASPIVHRDHGIEHMLGF